MTTVQLTTSLKSLALNDTGPFLRVIARIYLMSIQLKSVAAKQRSRRQLASLDEHQLRDIGISREEANNEAEKLPWE